MEGTKAKESADTGTVRSNEASHESVSERSTSYPQETSSNSSKESDSPSKSLCSSSSTSSENMHGIEMKVWDMYCIQLCCKTILYVFCIGHSIYIL